MHLFAAAALCSLLLAASAIAAEELTRVEYKERVEPICKTNVLANKRIFKGAKGEVKAGKLKPASTHFLRAATAFGKTISQLEAVPRPLGDEAKLSKWFAALRTEKALIEKIGRALKAEDKRKAESFSAELNRNSNKANNAVLGFDLDYCLIDQSRFG
ncbi:MAG TPA: hypothetical protein VFX45_08280 [Solirubrobacterales bacterium]|nr:hypothetical protein [Solirubrobacterales bacterium]